MFTLLSCYGNTTAQSDEWVTYWNPAMLFSIPFFSNSDLPIYFWVGFISYRLTRLCHPCLENSFFLVHLKSNKATKGWTDFSHSLWTDIFMSCRPGVLLCLQPPISTLLGLLLYWLAFQNILFVKLSWYVMALVVFFKLIFKNTLKKFLRPPFNNFLKITDDTASVWNQSFLSSAQSSQVDVW